MSGKYTPSAYGSTLQAMVATPASTTEDYLMKPGKACDGDEETAGATMLSVTAGLIESDGNGGVGRAQETVRIPRQIWRIVEALLENSAYQQPGLFVERGDESEVQGIQEAVDKGSELPEDCAHSMAEVRTCANTYPRRACLCLMTAENRSPVARGRSAVTNVRIRCHRSGMTIIHVSAETQPT